MCGRYTLTKPEYTVKKNLQVEIAGSLQPLYNACPTMMLPIICSEYKQTVNFFRWGLVPFWAKDLSIGPKLINARSETLTEKPAFRAAFRYRRCLVLADGYYEWQARDNSKVPYRITLKDEPLLTFAGLWEAWHSSDGGTLYSFCIITTAAAPAIAHLHDRMPALLQTPEQRNLWLSDINNTKPLIPLLQPYTATPIHFYPVTKAVNKAGFNSPELIQPLPIL